MQQVIGQILPLAVGIDISALSIAAVILMLGTPRRAPTAWPSSSAGWLGLFVVGGIALVLASALGLSSSTDSTCARLGVINLVLGVLLLVLAARGWRSRPQSGEEPPLPKWMASLDTITPPRSAGLAALLSGINPKNLALNLAAMSIIAVSRTLGVVAVVALLVFVVLASVAIIVPGRRLFRRWRPGRRRARRLEAVPGRQQPGDHGRPVARVRDGPDRQRDLQLAL